MRAEFVSVFEKIALKDRKVLLLTGDLGFNAFEGLQRKLGERFINAGVAEHNMVTVAGGLNYIGFRPWIYSIAPFVTIKVIEEIRNDICFANRDVKIVGLGGGYDYGNAGPTHHALQDIASLLSLPHMRIFVPAFLTDFPDIVNRIYKTTGPAYLRMAKTFPVNVGVPKYAACRRIVKGDKIVVVALGPMVSQVVNSVTLDKKLKGRVEVWLVSELPLRLPHILLDKIKKVKKLCIVEEHVRVGGLSSFMSQAVLEAGIGVNRFAHLYAKGYVSGLYGSHEFHLKESGLDAKSITGVLKRLI